MSIGLPHRVIHLYSDSRQMVQSRRYVPGTPSLELRLRIHSHEGRHTGRMTVDGVDRHTHDPELSRTPSEPQRPGQSQHHPVGSGRRSVLERTAVRNCAGGRDREPAVPADPSRMRPGADLRAPEYCPDPVLVTIDGSNWGGSMLKMSFIGRGMRLEFRHPQFRTIMTSRIVNIRQD